MSILACPGGVAFILKHLVPFFFFFLQDVKLVNSSAIKIYEFEQSTMLLNMPYL